MVTVVAAQDGTTVSAEVAVEVAERHGGHDRASGIPEPIAVHAPGERWRSRLSGERWEFNAAHADYLAAEAAADRSRLR